MTERRLSKRLIGGIYSATAERLYEPIVVKGAFRLFGGDLHQLIFAQQRRAVAVAAGRPILDMPVGTAFFTVEMARSHEGLVVGVDIAEGMVRKAKRTAAGAGVANLVLVQADAHHLPFRDGCFGAAVCSNGLPVMPGLDAILNELARVVASTGTLFASAITVPVGALMTARSRGHLPTMLRPVGDIAAALTSAGFRRINVRRGRLAKLFEASAR